MCLSRYSFIDESYTRAEAQSIKLYNKVIMTYNK